MVLVGAYSIPLCNSGIYLWGNIAPYVISYFYYFGETDGERNLSLQKDIGTVIPLLTISMAVMNPISAFLFRIAPTGVILAFCAKL